MSDTQPTAPASQTPLAQRVAERREEAKDKPKSDDGDLHHELHDDFQRQKNESANAWRFA